MIEVLLWYLLVSLLGLLAWPLAFRLMPGLPDRGYASSRALALLLVGYIFWLFTSLGFLQNTGGGILFAILFVIGLAIWAYSTRPDKNDSLTNWAVNHRALIITSEVLFALAFAGWAFVRAYNPELNSTEKPMELTFLNGVRQSLEFPPRDPWLSGYSIAYYYFGYVIITMLAMLTGTATSVAFNLGIALLFSLTLLGSYGLVYNLISAIGDRGGAALSALLGPIFTGLMGNLEGFLELVRAINLPVIPARFWTWLDIEDLTDPISKVLWPPDQWRFWWWWRASRVIRDRDLAGVAIGLQPIDEFPMFSFLLGDMHPHVLALPFVLLALTLAFNFLRQENAPSRPQFVLLVVCFGGLAFLNTWDFPIYLFVLVGVLALRDVRSGQPVQMQTFVRPVLTGATIFILGVLAYLPWYLSFTSQAGGILPNAIFPTRLHQYLVMFGLFIVILGWYLIDLMIAAGRQLYWKWAATLAVGLLVGLAGIMLAASFVAISTSPQAREFLLASAGVSAQALPPDAVNEATTNVVREVLLNRLAHPLTPLLLTGIIAACIALLGPRRIGEDRGSPAPTAEKSLAHAHLFALLLILTAAMLTLAPEFVYLRDGFMQRLNTVFKFYYAAWALFSVAGAFAVYALVSKMRPIGKTIFSGLVLVLSLMSLVYPAFAIPTKMGPITRSAADPPPTLDGIDYIRRQYPGDYRGIQWLQQNATPGSVVLEAVGGSYTYYGRVSSATGLPTVIGWPGHEDQWRGALFTDLAGGRESAVHEIYNTNSVSRAEALLTSFHVRYVFVGSLERSPSFASEAGLQKFDRFLTVAYRDQDVVIYQFDRADTEAQR